MPATLRPYALFALLLLAALALRWDTFGDPNLHGDEVFYFTVGNAMHHGALPYVDVWDRKPFGLFAIYWLIAGLSTAPLAYQLAACLSVAGTATAIGAIANELRPRAGGDLRQTNAPSLSVQGLRLRGHAEWLGGLLAGMCYLLWLKPLQGFGGQAPIFYNLPIACAALLVLRALPALREGKAPMAMAGAMLLGGLAIAVKTSALFEAAFFGLYAATVLLRSPMPKVRAVPIITGWALLGALPSLAIALFYWADGHWAEFWHAMVASNLAKQTYWEWIRLEMLALFLAPILLLAAFGLMEEDKGDRRFVLLWLLAALVGLCAVPNFYLHYGLPLLVPLCVAAAGFLGRGMAGVIATALVAGLALWIAPFQNGHARQSREAIAALEAAVRAHIGEGPLLLYDAPPQLYQRTGQPFVTPLVFPTHLSHLIEKDVSHLSTLGETKRVLALKPGAVVMAVPPRNGPVNEETHRLVLAYVAKHCRVVKVQATPEWQRTDRIVVWGDCADDPQTVAIMNEIETEARLPTDAVPLTRYSRAYAFLTKNRVLAVFSIPHSKSQLSCDLALRQEGGQIALMCPPPLGMVPNERRWFAKAEELPVFNDGGCGVITVEYDWITRRVISVSCNDHA